LGAGWGGAGAAGPSGPRAGPGGPAVARPRACARACARRATRIRPEGTLGSGLGSGSGRLTRTGICGRAVTDQSGRSADSDRAGLDGLSDPAGPGARWSTGGLRGGEKRRRGYPTCRLGGAGVQRAEQCGRAEFESVYPPGGKGRKENRHCSAEGLADRYGASVVVRSVCYYVPTMDRWTGHLTDGGAARKG
jgi:hypothetical protein